jgi:hypothetical protein
VKNCPIRIDLRCDTQPLIIDEIAIKGIYVRTRCSPGTLTQNWLPAEALLIRRAIALSQTSAMYYSTTSFFFYSSSLPPPPPFTFRAQSDPTVPASPPSLHPTPLPPTLPPLFLRLLLLPGRAQGQVFPEKYQSTTHHPHPTPTTLVSSIDGPELVCLQLRPTGCHDLSLHIGINLSIQVGTD